MTARSGRVPAVSIFLFIRFFALDFLHASASAKLVNIATNPAALVFFIPSGNVLWAIALPMALFNILGALTVPGWRCARGRGSCAGCS
jgi:uncharacterized membrane protein YfcA